MSLGLTDSCHGALAVDAAHFARGYKKAERLRLRLCSRGKRRRRSRRAAPSTLLMIEEPPKLEKILIRLNDSV